MEVKPLVTIITVVYNGGKTIEQTIKSVISQSYNNIEYIIIDGKSTDDTLKIVSLYKDKIKCVISEEDNGLYDAMNKGIALANGHIIGLLNADDYYEENAVTEIVSNYEEGFVYYHGALRNLQNDGQSFVNPPAKTLTKLKRGMIINHPTVFVNREVYNKIGNFDLNFGIAADWDFTLRCYLGGVKFKSTNKIITNFRLNGMSSAISREYLRELHTVRKKNNLFHKIDYYYIYDKLRFLVMGKNLYKLYLLKKRIIHAH